MGTVKAIFDAIGSKLATGCVPLPEGDVFQFVVTGETGDQRDSGTAVS